MEPPIVATATPLPTRVGLSPNELSYMTRNPVLSNMGSNSHYGPNELHTRPQAGRINQRDDETKNLGQRRRGYSITRGPHMNRQNTIASEVPLPFSHAAPSRRAYQTMPPQDARFYEHKPSIHSNEPSYHNNHASCSQMPIRGGFNDGARLAKPSGRRDSLNQVDGGSFAQHQRNRSLNQGPNEAPSGLKHLPRSSPRQPPHTARCPNQGWNETGMYEYIPCDCTYCGERNRSIFVKFLGQVTDHPMDLQTRIKMGITSRFGEVEHVVPLAQKKYNGFIVR